MVGQYAFFATIVIKRYDPIAADHFVILVRSGPDAYHDSVCIFYITEGEAHSVEFSMADPSAELQWSEGNLRRFLLSAGDTFYVPSGNMFRLKNNSKDACCKLYVTFIKECA